MASLYNMISKENCDAVEYLHGEWISGTLGRDEAEKQIAHTVKDEPKLQGAQEYFAWWCLAVCREIVYPPYGVACEDGKIRLPYKLVGSSIADDVTKMPHNPHDCPGGRHQRTIWPLCDLTPEAPSVQS